MSQNSKDRPTAFVVPLDSGPSLTFLAIGTQMTTIEVKVLDAIRARGTQSFSGAEIASEAGLCRQTVYKIIRKLNTQGHRIEGERGLGFMARVREP